MFGVSRFATILPTIIEVMILLFFAYKLSTICYKDKRAAFLAVFLIAFNPLIFYYSTSVMLEIASAMFLVITVYYFSLYFLEKSNRYLYFTAIGSALAILTKPPMVLILPVLFLALLWDRGLSFSSLRKKHKQIAVSIVLFFVFLSPWIIELAVLETQGLSGLSKWTAHAGGFEKRFVEGFPLMDGTIRSYTEFSTVQNFVFYSSTILHTWYLIPFFILAIVFLVKKIRALNIIEKASIVMVLVFFITFSIYSGAQPRFMIYIIPFIIIPTSRAIIKVFEKIKHPVVIAIIILAVAQCSHFLIATGNEFPVGKFDEASLYVIEDTESETSVVSSQYRAQAFSFALLDKERKIYVLYMPRKESELEQMIEGKYSEPEWARFNIEYPKVNYIIVHEEYSKIDSDYDLLEFASKHTAFELVKTIEGDVPNTMTFIYKKNESENTFKNVIYKRIMRVLVTGCAGFIGSHVAEGLLNQGHEVVGIDNLDPYYSPELKKKNLEILKQNKDFKLIFGSILNKSILKKVGKLDIVNHQAAMAGVRSSIRNPLKYFTTNVLGTINLLEAFRDTDKFIYASSSSIYGEVPREELPVSEKKKPMPISPYSLSKLQGEAWCNMFSRLYGFNLTILRYFTVYGPRQRPDEAICKFICNILAGKPIEIYGDGKQTRDFTYVKDVVDANILALNEKPGLYNIGSGRSISVKELVEIIFRMAGKTKVILKKMQPGDVQDTLADITLARNELGYEPKYSIESGLREHIKWFREQKP